MVTQCETDGRVLAVIAHSPGATLDSVVRQYPARTWNHVFLAIDRFSRNGEMPVIGKSPGVYTLRLSEHLGATHMANELG